MVCFLHEVNCLQRVTSHRSNVNFKSFYQIHGSSQQLDEIGATLRARLKNPDIGMDFLAIRLNHEPKSSVQDVFAPPMSFVKPPDDNRNSYITVPRLKYVESDNGKGLVPIQASRFKRHTTTEFDTSEDSFELADKLLGERGWRDRDRIKRPTDIETIDLIITDNDKPAVQKSILNILADSISSKFGGRTFSEEMRIQADNESELTSNVAKGLPITNLRQNIVRDYLGFKFLEITKFKAQEVLKGLQQKTFDVHSGSFSLQG